MTLKQHFDMEIPLWADAVIVPLSPDEEGLMSF